MDYRRMLKLAGLEEAEANRIALEREAQDSEEASLDAAEQRNDRDREIEKAIMALAQETQVKLETNYPIFIDDSDMASITLYEGEIALSHVLSFANRLASAGIGSDIRIGASSASNVVISFKVHS